MTDRRRRSKDGDVKHDPFFREIYTWLLPPPPLKIDLQKKGSNDVTPARKQDRRHLLHAKIDDATCRRAKKVREKKVPLCNCGGNYFPFCRLLRESGNYSSTSMKGLLPVRQKEKKEGEAFFPCFPRLIASYRRPHRQHQERRRRKRRKKRIVPSLLPFSAPSSSFFWREFSAAKRREGKKKSAALSCSPGLPRIPS